jgi:hypothetical protein
MPVLAPAGSTPFVHPINLGTPLVAPIPPPGQMMPVGIAPSPSSAPMPPMPVFMTGGGTMPMTSPAALPGNFVQTPMALPPPMPNAMAPPSPSFGVLAGVLPQILKFGAHGPYAGLLYHSPHTVLHEGELYPTALHLFEARKFLDHRPDLARRIRQCDRVEMVTAISEELRAFTRPDWANVALVIVSNLSFCYCLFFWLIHGLVVAW